MDAKVSSCCEQGRVRGGAGESTGTLMMLRDHVDEVHHLLSQFVTSPLGGEGSGIPLYAAPTFHLLVPMLPRKAIGSSLICISLEISLSGQQFHLSLWCQHGKLCLLEMLKVKALPPSCLGRLASLVLSEQASKACLRWSDSMSQHDLTFPTDAFAGCAHVSQDYSTRWEKRVFHAGQLAQGCGLHSLKKREFECSGLSKLK